MQRTLLWLGLALVACHEPASVAHDAPTTSAQPATTTQGPAPQPVTTTPSSSSAVSTSAGATGGPASVPASRVGVPSPEVLKKICAAPCGGPTSSIDVYRDAEGKVARLRRLYGSCSHNAALYFDARGNETETIPERPVVAGSDEAKGFEARSDRQTAGLTRAETVSCRP